MGFQEAQQNLFEPEAARSLLDKLLTNSQLYSQSKDYKELLDFVIRLRNFSPFNAMLLQVQKPGLMYAASAYDWLQRFSRTPKEGARPLLILWPFGPVALVYDVMDTEGGCLPADVGAFAAEGDVKAVLMAAFVELTNKKRIDCCWINAGEGLAGSIRMVLRAANSKEFTEYRMQINQNHAPAVQFNTLTHELGHLFLGHLGPDKKLNVPWRAKMDYPQRELEAESVAYLVCARNGVRSKSEAYLTNHVTTTTTIGDVDVYQVIRAAGQVEALLELAPRLLHKSVSAEQAEPKETVEVVPVAEISQNTGELAQSAEEEPLLVQPEGGTARPVSLEVSGPEVMTESIPVLKPDDAIARRLPKAVAYTLLLIAWSGIMLAVYGEWIRRREGSATGAATRSQELPSVSRRGAVEEESWPVPRETKMAEPRKVIMQADIDAAWADPDFNAASEDKRIWVMERMDPRFGALPGVLKHRVAARMFKEFGKPVAAPQRPGMEAAPASTSVSRKWAIMPPNTYSREDIESAWRDPEFHQLPEEVRIQKMSRVDSRFAALDRLNQRRIVDRFARQVDGIQPEMARRPASEDMAAAEALAVPRFAPPQYGGLAQPPLPRQTNSGPIRRRPESATNSGSANPRPAPDVIQIDDPPPNTSEILKGAIDPTSKHQLRISNRTGSHAIVKLRAPGARLDSLVFFVRADEEASISGVRDGNYRLLYGFGTGWNLQRGFFGKYLGAWEFDSLSSFQRNVTSDGEVQRTAHDVIKVTLHKVSGGNASTHRIDDSEFMQ